MSPRARVLAITVAAVVVASGGAVAFAVLTSTDAGGGGEAARPGTPPLVLDLGARVDPEARALRRAEVLYDEKRRAAAARVFARYDSPEAQVGAAFAAWPDDGLERLEQLARERPRNALVLLHLGFARLWAGQGQDAIAAWRAAKGAQPDSPSAERADDVLHPRFPVGQPHFVPNFPPPAGLRGLSPPRQLALLRRAARRNDVRAKLLYGLALQRLRRRVSAQREFDAAVRLDPDDPEARVAAALVRFDKDRPSAAFSRLGPLTRRFPHAQTVRFHLGLLLFWLARAQPGSVEEGKRQLRLARSESPATILGREATRLLARLA